MFLKKREPMAIKIRCTQCQKKISIDEAFAGGVCRCPYCSGLVMVAGSQPAAAASARPDSPDARPEAPGDRPDSPAAAPATEEAPAPVEPQHVPLARPVKIQGILSIVFIAGFFIMVGVITYLVYTQLNKVQEKPPAPPTPMTDRTEGAPAGAAAIMGMQIKGPVVYVLDAGTSMRDTLSYAVKMIRLSAPTLKDDKFNLIVLTEAESKSLSSSFLPGSGGDEKIKKFFEEPLVYGRTQLDKSMNDALDMKPATIVLMTAKAMEPDAIAQVVAKAKQQNTMIVVVLIGSGQGSELDQTMSELAKQTGGHSKAFSVAELDDWSNKTKDVD